MRLAVGRVLKASVKGAKKCGDVSHGVSEGGDVENYELTDEFKKRIDAMSHYELAEKWRFASTGDPLIMGDVGKYFSDRLFKHFGGIPPEMSKTLGHGR